MRLGCVIFVPDVHDAVMFYERALGLRQRFIAGDGLYGEMEVAGSFLGFVRHDQGLRDLPDGYRPITPGARAHGMEVALEVVDVDLAFERALRAGATPTALPRDRPWGQRAAHVRDRNGVLVELTGVRRGVVAAH